MSVTGTLGTLKPRRQGDVGNGCPVGSSGWCPYGPKQPGAECGVFTLEPACLGGNLSSVTYCSRLPDLSWLFKAFLTQFPHL